MGDDMKYFYLWGQLFVLPFVFIVDITPITRGTKHNIYIWLTSNNLVNIKNDNTTISIYENINLKFIFIFPISFVLLKKLDTLVNIPPNNNP